MGEGRCMGLKGRGGPPLLLLLLLPRADGKPACVGMEETAETEGRTEAGDGGVMARGELCQSRAAENESMSESHGVMLAVCNAAQRQALPSARSSLRRRSAWKTARLLALHSLHSSSSCSLTDATAL